MLEKFKKYVSNKAEGDEISALIKNARFGAEFFKFDEIANMRYVNNVSFIR